MNAIKNAASVRKHGIPFELEAQIFEDEYCLVDADRVDEESGELRWHAIGKAVILPGREVMLLTVHVCREDNHGKEVIRIISPRG